MKEIYITEKEEGQQLYKILEKYLDQAPSSFLYKMLRKKNITLNGKKADGSE
ncbi:MAG: RluA family pseudouridine synthase, partial [Lachnospiraceae bacterium]|nr:RluA family pseudouridine synthase [Lachnospiraceae bacterium]